MRSARAEIQDVSTSARAKGRRNAGQTQEAIFRAALAEFTSKGLDGARVDRIAERAGANKRMIYHYFGGKEDLFLAVLERTYAAIRSAEESITIENAYFVPPEELREALIDAAKRGVDVRVMTNSRASNDMGIVSDASRYYYDELIDAGVKIYEKQGGTLHSKTMTFDGEFSIVGSVNFNGRSHGLDAESARRHLADTVVSIDDARARDAGRVGALCAALAAAGRPCPQPD